jgi:5-methylcytosine-specific restriction endonuclease McrA
VTLALRPCIGRNPDGSLCRALSDSSRCEAHAVRYPYGRSWRKTRDALVARHRMAAGDWCPGFGVPAHPSADLTGDHRVPVSAGGSRSAANVAVLCRSCNARKGAGA